MDKGNTTRIKMCQWKGTTQHISCEFLQQTHKYLHLNWVVLLRFAKCLQSQTRKKYARLRSKLLRDTCAYYTTAAARHFASADKWCEKRNEKDMMRQAVNIHITPRIAHEARLMLDFRHRNIVSISLFSRSLSHTRINFATAKCRKEKECTQVSVEMWFSNDARMYAN